LSGLGDVPNMEITFENFRVASARGNGLVTPVLGFSRFREGDNWASLFYFLGIFKLCLVCLIWKPLDLLGIFLMWSWVVPKIYKLPRFLLPDFVL
jgi:hypothetical protein